MFWTGFCIGAFLGANIGVVVASLLISARKNDAQEHLRETLMDQAVVDEVQELERKLLSLHKPVKYFDGYPHS
jgi:hypothetical protein